MTDQQCFKQHPHDPHNWGSLGSGYKLCPGIPSLARIADMLGKALKDHEDQCDYWQDNDREALGAWRDDDG